MANLAKALRGSGLYAPIRRERLRRLTRRPGAYPDWNALLSREADAWREALAAPKTKRVLVATQIGLHFTANAIDSLNLTDNLAQKSSPDREVLLEVFYFQNIRHANTLAAEFGDPSTAIGS